MRNMKKYLVTGVIGILLLSLAIGGTILAYFTDEAGARQSEFLFGTVEIEKVGDLQAIEESIYDNEREVKWTIKNTGTKAAKIRVGLFDQWFGGGNGELECWGKETAWREGTRFVPPPGNWAMYFTYDAQSGGAQTVNLIAGQNHNAGTITVSKDANNLYLEFNTTGNWRIMKLDIHAAGSLAGIPKNPQGIPSPGSFAYKYPNLGNVTTYNVTIPLSAIGSHNIYYIAAHAEVQQCESSGQGVGDNGDPNINIFSCNSAWTLGADGYWYHCASVAPGETVEFCITIEKLNDEWEGTYELYLEAEAVQASHNAIDTVWPGNPCTTP